MKALIIAAPHSGAGKTLITLGILRAARDAGFDVAAAKSGPDYIDPRFHEAALGRASVNLDAWAMTPARTRALARAQGGEVLVVEAAMGLFDGAPAADAPLGRGSAADLAASLGASVILVIDIARQAQSAAALALGFARARGDVGIAGVILNRVGSPRHGRMAATAIEALTGLPVLGICPRARGAETPSRHLGLVQAEELEDLEGLVARAGAMVAEHVDVAALIDLASPLAPGEAGERARALPPLGQRVAVARDRAFGFVYPHLLADWRAAGAEIACFSPLADEGPAADADAVFLPGGYPELHGGALANARRFREGMRGAAARGALIYGECGGYMTLGRGLIDADGARHQMLGLLPVETSFAEPGLQLGYRRLTPLPGAPWTRPLAGHEFHYARATEESVGAALYEARDAMGEALPPMGRREGAVMGSFAHVIDMGPDQ